MSAAESGCENGEEEPAGEEVIACCDSPDVETQTTCGLCETALCGNCRSLVNDSPVCGDCKDKVLRELQKEKAGVLSMPLAIAGGVIGALIAGAIWAAIVIGTNTEIGYIAIGVGWLAGMGVYLGSGKKKGQQLQVLSVACAILGLICAKYFILAHAIVELAREKGVELSYLSLAVMEIFVQNIHKMFGGFDILWVVFALGAAWKISAPTEVVIGK